MPSGGTGRAKYRDTMFLAKPLPLTLLTTLLLFAPACVEDSPPVNPQCDNGACDERSRCYNLNAECGEGLTCQPTDLFERDQFCLPPGEPGTFCDDDDDCAGESVCDQEGIQSAGRCRGDYLEDERCYNFNFECAEGLTCRPRTWNERDQFCLPPGGLDKPCDDDDDCVSGLHCLDEGLGFAGRCGRP